MIHDKIASTSVGSEGPCAASLPQTSEEGYREAERSGVGPGHPSFSTDLVLSS